MSEQMRLKNVRFGMGSIASGKVNELLLKHGALIML